MKPKGIKTFLFYHTCQFDWLTNVLFKYKLTEKMFVMVNTLDKVNETYIADCEELIDIVLMEESRYGDCHQ